MASYILLGLLTVASLAGVLAWTWRLLRRRRPRFMGATAVVWAITTVTFLILWFPSFLVGGSFGGAILSWGGKYATLLGIGLGLAIAMTAPAILMAWLLSALVLSRKEGSANI